MKEAGSMKDSESAEYVDHSSIQIALLIMPAETRHLLLR